MSGLWIVHKFYSNINYSYFIIALLVYSMVLGLRSFKMNKMINVYTPAKYKDTVTLTASSQLMGAFIPGRAGEILISAYLKLKHAVDISKVLPLLFLDKIIELLCVLLYSAVSILFFSKDLLTYFSGLFNGNEGSGRQYWYIAAVLVLIIVLFLLKRFMGPKLASIVNNIKQSLLIPFKQPVLGLTIVVVSLFTMILEYSYLYFIFHAFNIGISLPQVIIVHSFGMIIGVISMIPGGQGSTEISMIAILHLWGFTTINVLTPILASKLFTYFILILYALPLLPYSITIIRNRKLTSKAGEE